MTQTAIEVTAPTATPASKTARNRRNKAATKRRRLNYPVLELTMAMLKAEFPVFRKKTLIAINTFSDIKKHYMKQKMRTNNTGVLLGEYVSQDWYQKLLENGAKRYFLDGKTEQIVRKELVVEC